MGLWKNQPPKTPKKWCSVISSEARKLLLIDPQYEDLEYGNAAQLRQCIDWALKTRGDVILNLTQTLYLDSSALGLILSLSKEIGAQGYELIMVAPIGETVHTILGLTRLTDLFNRVNTYEEALKALAHSEPAA